MPLNQAQQLELQRMLDSDVFKAAKEEVLRMTDGSLKDLLAPEAAIKMALEKGTRHAFTLLQKISVPIQFEEPLPRRTITRTPSSK